MSSNMVLRRAWSLHRCDLFWISSTICSSTILGHGFPDATLQTYQVHAVGNRFHPLAQHALTQVAEAWRYTLVNAS
jgi:hypothetical protein